MERRNIRRWLKLDNAAKIYPSNQTRDHSTLYRLSVTLKSPVDADLLHRAHLSALRRFPSFACTMKRGLFWYYLEPNPKPPLTVEETFAPVQKIRFRENNGYLYRLLYRGNRISGEFFHALSDGTGSMTFLMTIVGEYLHLRYGEKIEPSQYILNVRENALPEEYEDSFLTYATKETIGFKENVAYRTEGTPIGRQEIRIISGEMPMEATRSKAREYGVTIGEYLTAVLLRAYYVCQQREPSRRRRRMPIRISVPINLRRLFPTKSLRNFSSYINVELPSRLGDYTFTEMVARVKHYMALHTDPKELRARISGNVKTEKILPIRLLPLFLKNPIMKVSSFLFGWRYMTSTITNLGRMDFGEQVNRYIARMDFVLSRSARPQHAVGCIGFGDSLYLNFTRSVEEADIEREFFCFLVEEGIPVRVESNQK